MDLSERTAKELRSLKQNVERHISQNIDRERAEALLLKIKAEEDLRDAIQIGSKLSWRSKSRQYELLHEKKTVAMIRTVGNHSHHERDVYSAEILGKFWRRFEYIEKAKEEVLEEVNRRLSHENA